MGYRVSIINAREKIPIIDYHLTRAIHHDAGALIALLLSVEHNQTLPKFAYFYGDNAYFTSGNVSRLEFYEKGCQSPLKRGEWQEPEQPTECQEKIAYSLKGRVYIRDYGRELLFWAYSGSGD